ncbi:MAG: holo-ACP synthase [Actinobacteria bacterium]|nr:holo-ACP synthase [Actinomycetota bacterium]
MIGIDVVDVERFRATLERSPGLPGRLFTDDERAYCLAGADPVVHMAGTLAAKEAVIKALSLGNLAAWARRVEVTRGASGAPSVKVTGRRETVGISITHDGGYAAAVAFRDISGEPVREASEEPTREGRGGNGKLDRFLDRPSPFARVLYPGSDFP